MEIKDVLKLIEDEDIAYVDVRLRIRRKGDMEGNRNRAGYASKNASGYYPHLLSVC